MNKIKFSHMYQKLRQIDKTNPVTLIHVMPVKLSDLSDDFIEYDTLYYEKAIKKNYPLKDGNYLLLFFIDTHSRLFTTIRRSTPKNNEYYMTAIGSRFELVINDK